MNENKKNRSFNISSGVLRLMPHMHPHIRISPFTAHEWSRLINGNQAQTSSADEDPTFWLDGASDLQFYDSGRTALLACFKHFNLKNDDEVLIITTTDGPYISSCVTKTIEKVCRWSRESSKETRLVLVIHEFGFPCSYEKIKPFKKSGLPILEDCAYALGSRMEGASVGKCGDFAIYSLTKYYPMPFGGVLASKAKVNNSALDLAASPEDTKLLKLTLKNAQPYLKNWNKIRRSNWQYFADKLSGHDFLPYFDLADKFVPGVFLTKVPENFAGEEVKKRLNTAGVESTQYYNQGGFYFPVHQFLTQYEKEYILHYFLGEA